jgi:uncharacterized membrane-anchored protein YhcB (DUF1043 family)
VGAGEGGSAVTAETWVAIATFVLAAVTLGLVVATLWVTSRDRQDADTRLNTQLDNANTRLETQLNNANTRLDRQLNNANEQLDRVFRDADARLAEERHDARVREQLAEARAIEVILGNRPAGLEDLEDSTLVRVPGASGDPEEDLRQLGLVVLTAAVINHGRYTITGIECELVLRERGKVPFSSAKRITGDKARDDKLLGGVTPFESDWTEKTVLSPWDTGLALVSNPMAAGDTPDASVVVRWTDQWGTQWENVGDRVRKVEPDAADG